jgi:hypothetical protein
MRSSSTRATVTTGRRSAWKACRRIAARWALVSAYGSPKGSSQRDIFAFVGSTSSFGGNSLQQEIGLGDAESIVELEVAWPVSKTVQRFKDGPMDHFLEIREGDTAFHVVNRPEQSTLQ